MVYKWIGAVLIITGCGGFGFSLSAAHRREERHLRRLMDMLDFMARDLCYRATPLPELVTLGAGEGGRELSGVFRALGEALRGQVAPEVAGCMEAVLGDFPGIPPQTREILRDLGSQLGRFDLPGQLKGLEQARECCRSRLEALEVGREDRLRNYQTLSLCAGAALALILV